MQRARTCAYLMTSQPQACKRAFSRSMRVFVVDVGIGLGWEAKGRCGRTTAPPDALSKYASGWQTGHAYCARTKLPPSPPLTASGARADLPPFPSFDSTRRPCSPTSPPLC
eukprot:364271-Chlamydomonas_euryale.AAC.3